jgi:hypothetical protein
VAIEQYPSDSAMSSCGDEGLGRLASMVEGASGGSTGMENVEAGPIMRAYFCVLVVCVFFHSLSKCRL